MLVVGFLKLAEFTLASVSPTPYISFHRLNEANLTDLLSIASILSQPLGHSTHHSRLHHRHPTRTTLQFVSMCFPSRYRARLTWQRVSRRIISSILYIGLRQPGINVSQR